VELNIVPRRNSKEEERDLYCKSHRTDGEQRCP